AGAASSKERAGEPLPSVARGSQALCQRGAQEKSGPVPARRAREVRPCASAARKRSQALCQRGGQARDESVVLRLRLGFDLLEQTVDGPSMIFAVVVDEAELRVAAHGERTRQRASEARGDRLDRLEALHFGALTPSPIPEPTCHDGYPHIYSQGP